MRAIALATAVLLAFSMVALVPEAPWSATGEAAACIPHVNGCEGCFTDVWTGGHDGRRECI